MIERFKKARMDEGIECSSILISMYLLVSLIIPNVAKMFKCVWQAVW